MRIKKKDLLEMLNSTDNNNLKQASDDVSGITKKISDDITNLKTNLSKELGSEEDAQNFMNAFISTDVNEDMDNTEDVNYVRPNYSSDIEVGADDYEEYEKIKALYGGVDENTNRKIIKRIKLKDIKRNG
jgi:hypothetical protein